jgi:Methyltransferase domain
VKRAVKKIVKRIVLIGSFDVFQLNALHLNDGEGSSHGEMLCVEPYPSPKISELADHQRKLYPKQAQDVEIKAVRELDENDILFIDSSHVAKVDSDVNWLYLEVLPNLRKGVVIHIHDISFPY